MNDTVYGVSPGLDYIKYTVSNDWNALPQFTLPHPAGYRFEMITRCDHFPAMHTHRGECGFFVHIEQNDIIM